MNYFMVIFMALLFYVLGALMPRFKRNFFVGIRTPWTLSSDVVWKKTHSLGGILFKAAAVIGIIGLFFIEYAVWFIIVPIICAVAITMVCSYFTYQKEIKAGRI